MPVWDARYGEEGYAYGTDPNGFLVQSVDHLGSPVLCLASGEGRNVVWLARQGLEVQGVDASAVGVRKTLELAESLGVSVRAELGDLEDLDLGEDCWGGIVSIFCHLPPGVREAVHGRVVRALRPGGALVLEAYAAAQLGRGTGGPPARAMLYTLAELRAELTGLDLLVAQEVERDVVEGRYHTGRAAVVQVVGVKPRR